MTEYIMNSCIILQTAHSCAVKANSKGQKIQL